MPILTNGDAANANREILHVPNYTRTSREEDNYFVTMYMGAQPDTLDQTLKGADPDRSLPQAYLVEQPADSEIPAHYHDTDQYQVFIYGNAMFGKKTIESCTVHFAGGHTPYGPIKTLGEPTHFFTLRANWDGGGKPMPENRANLKPVKRVYRLAQVDKSMLQADSADVVPVEANGLGTSLFSLEPEQTKTLELSVNGGGQYALVLEGAIEFDGKLLAVNSALYRHPNEAALVVTGAKPGTKVLVCQFPTHEPLDPASDRYRS